MSYSYQRIYRGQVRAVIFDWAGTTVDYGCQAPAKVFYEVFKKYGLELSMELIRRPMGIHKRTHIEILTADPEVALKWKQVHGREVSSSDVDKMFADFVPMQLACLKDHSELIPGFLETMAELRRQGLKIGSTTGYTADMMEIVAPLAAKAGYSPDFMVSSSEVPRGRPTPWMALEIAKRMDVYPLESIVKVGDTVADIEEGLNAGMWSVGLVASSNEMGLTYQESLTLKKNNPKEYIGRYQKASRTLEQAGAHYVIDSIAEVPKVLEMINQRLSAGNKF